MIRVVLAEDQAMVRGALSALLNLESDIDVVGEAADGEIAWRELQRCKPDVLVTDIEMPGLTGLELRLDARFREVHVGQWQGLRVEQVRERFPDDIAALDRGEDVPRGVTGETRAQVAARAGAAIRDVERELLPGETAVVVAHGVSGRLAATELVGLDPEVADAVLRGVDNCHWIDLVETGRSYSYTSRWRIAGWNLGPWRA